MCIPCLCCPSPVSLIFFLILPGDTTSPRLLFGLHWLSLQPHWENIAKLKCIFLAVLSWHVDWKKKKSWPNSLLPVGVEFYWDSSLSFLGHQNSPSPQQNLYTFQPSSGPGCCLLRYTSSWPRSLFQFNWSTSRVSINCQVLNSGAHHCHLILGWLG